MDWLSIAGAVFLTWLVLVSLFTPGMNYHLAKRTVGSRRRFPLHAAVSLPRGAAQGAGRRGVAVSVIVPGRITERWVRLASRRMSGELLRAGVRIHEDGPAMTHARILIVDELWSVLGTTNIDNRSFEHNDEINLAMRDPEVAARLLQDFERDLGASEEVTLEHWQRRPLWEKVVGPFVWILERQQ